MAARIFAANSSREIDVERCTRWGGVLKELDYHLLEWCLGKEGRRREGEGGRETDRRQPASPGR